MGSSHRHSSWAKSGHQTPLALGEEMLSEQLSLDGRFELLRRVDDPSLRHHITGNIASRLKQEWKTQGQEALSVQQKCLNIKKHLADMTSFRRELSSLKTQVELLNDVPAVKNEEPLLALAAGFHSRCKRDQETGAQSFAGVMQRVLKTSATVGALGGYTAGEEAMLAAARGRAHTTGGETLGGQQPQAMHDRRTSADAPQPILDVEVRMDSTEHIVSL
jgi:hypothetical protein